MTSRTSMSLASPTASTSIFPNGVSGPAVSTVLPTPPELEQTLALLSSRRSVLGYLLLSIGHPVSIIRHSGVVFDGEQGRKYAAAIGRIVDSVRHGLAEVANDNAEVDELRFMRIRTKRHEIMISPDDRYLLAVLHDPTT